MARIALLVRYDGTHFNGFQLQPEGRTIQGDLERAVKTVTGETARVIASGRTDTGVHALGQVAHFDLSRNIPLSKLAISLNGVLEQDLSISNLYHVPDDFHARFSAKEREYLFFIYNNPLRSPFARYRMMWVTAPLDLSHMREAASYLIGEHDFASFCKKSSAEEGTVRCINSITIERNDEDVISIRIAGNAFLHNQIRATVGTLVHMQKNNLPPDFMKSILEERNRDCAGFTAPPYGLYLNRISYDPPLKHFPSAFYRQYTTGSSSQLVV